MVYSVCWNWERKNKNMFEEKNFAVKKKHAMI